MFDRLMRLIRIYFKSMRLIRIYIESVNQRKNDDYSEISF